MDFWRFRAATQLYIIQIVAPRNYRYAIQIENFIIYVLTYREHPNFYLNYWTGTAIGFHMSHEHKLKFFVFTGQIHFVVPGQVWEHWKLLTL